MNPKLANTPAAAALHSAGVDISEVRSFFIALGKECHERGWVLGTSGNFSAVVGMSPLRLAITRTGLDKGRLTEDQILLMDETGSAVEGVGAPSDEAIVHLTVVRATGAISVLHTHSVWSTILSETCSHAGGVEIEGYEMLKGLSGIRTHEHREWLPIVENSQSGESLGKSVAEALDRNPHSHGFLLRRHGLYTWGSSLHEAKRHLEVLEFLLEVLGRTGVARKQSPRS